MKVRVIQIVDMARDINQEIKPPSQITDPMHKKAYRACLRWLKENRPNGVFATDELMCWISVQRPERYNTKEVKVIVSFTPLEHDDFMAVFLKYNPNSGSILEMEVNPETGRLYPVEN